MANERLTRAEAIKAYREARDQADLVLVGFMLENPDENLSGLCKDADPENWNALRTRVQRRIQKASSEDGKVRTIGRSPGEQTGDAKRFFSNPAVTGERKAEIVAAALEDDYVALQVANALANDPDLIQRIDKARKAAKPAVAHTPEQLTVDQRWEKWLNRINGLLIDGARLVDESKDKKLGGYASLAYEMYRRITERQLDAEIRQLLESQEAGL